MGDSSSHETHIIVHTKELLNQWIQRAESFLGIPAGEVGIIGAGKCTLGDRVIFLHLGDCRHTVEKTDLLDKGHLCQAQVIWHQTDFDTVLNASEEYSKVLSELTQDQGRNRQICKDVAAENSPGIKLVLSDRKAHCLKIQEILKQKHGLDAAVLVGGLSPKARALVTEQLNQGKVDIAHLHRATHW